MSNRNRDDRTDQSLLKTRKKRKKKKSSPRQYSNIVDKSWCHHRAEKSIHHFHDATRIIEELQPFCSRVKVITRLFATLTVNRGKQKEQSLRKSLDTFFRHGKHFRIEKIRHSRCYSLVYFPFTHFIRVYMYTYLRIQPWRDRHSWMIDLSSRSKERSTVSIKF